MRQFIVVLGFVSIIFFTLFTPQSTVSAVNNATDLNNAIINAPSGATITLTGDIVVNSALNVDNAFADIDKTLIIDGAGYTISRPVGAPNFRFFSVVTNGNLTLQNITLAGNPTNTMLVGAAIANQGTLAISNSILIDNSGYAGGAIWNNSTMSIEDSTFTNNQASSNGGAILNDLNSTTTIIANSTFTNNYAYSDGGAIYNQYDSIINLITDSIFEGNIADDGYGGAIRNETNSTITTIANSTFNNNTVLEGDGGVMRNSGYIQLITDSTFSNNTAPQSDGEGAAIRVSSAGVIDLITNSTFTNNQAGYEGGAFHITGQVTAITNSTFYQNFAEDKGSVIYNDGEPLLVTNNTFVDNTTNNIEGEIYRTTSSSAQITLNNNIFVHGTGQICNNQPISGANNVSNQANTGCAPVGFLPDLVDASLHLNALANYGGNTETIALINLDPINHPNPAINPAFNTPDATPTDQRGMSAQNARDIGAYETYQPVVAFSVPTRTVIEGHQVLNIELTVTPDPSEGDSGILGLFVNTSGTATAGDDYQAVLPMAIPFNCNGALTCTVTFPLTIYADGMFEPDETIILDITPIQGAIIGAQSQMTITIENVDPIPPTPAGLPAQPEDLGVIELPATGERPLWAELLAQWLGQ